MRREAGIAKLAILSRIAKCKSVSIAANQRQRRTTPLGHAAFQALPPGAFSATDIVFRFAD
jgi:hypothetical protein